jgi:hypothetical protein
MIPEEQHKRQCRLLLEVRPLQRTQQKLVQRRNVLAVQSRALLQHLQRRLRASVGGRCRETRASKAGKDERPHH